MLKFIFMILFMVPLIFLDWVILHSALILLTLMFMFELGCFEFVESLSLGNGLDLMSYMLILLSMWIIFLMMLSSEKIINYNFYKSQFLFVLLLLVLFLVLSFYSTNVFMFYLWFESSLIPTFFLILGWGYQSERLQAGIYMLLYTLIFSLPLMIMIFWLYNKTGSMNMHVGGYMVGMGLIGFIATFSAFLVKLPMFMLHLWLPKAHVEAPVSGSMILAGVLLKLGGYGIIRVSNLVWKNIVGYTGILIILSLFGGVLISLNCLRQGDLKMLIAYSSVSHMGMMLGGILTFSYWGLSSSLIVMLSHGLCSSGLFFLTNVCYERIGSRSFMFIKGLISLMPKMTLWWFLFCCLNMSAPPSLNLLGEIGLINSLVMWNWGVSILLALMGFFVAAYCLYLFSFSQHGNFSESIFSFSVNSIREFLILFLHWLPLNFLIIFSELSMDWI